MTYPTVTILQGRERRFLQGHPWLYSNEVQMDVAAKAIPAGAIVRIRTERGQWLGCGAFNPHSLIAVRRLDDDAGVVIDAAWFAARFKKALALREKFFAQPFYRLVHAEGDGLPGLVVDRYDTVAVVQANTAGMDALLPAISEALQSLGLTTVIAARAGLAIKLEGLADEVKILAGDVNGPVRVEENGLTYFADVLTGQKTGWFYDQRDNRAFVAGLAGPGQSVLDAYSYAGGFGLLAARRGAAATLIDSAAGALTLAEQAAAENGVRDRCTFIRGDVMDELTKFKDGQFDVVSLDPPAFVKAKKDMNAGLKGYGKLARLGAPIVAPGGFMAIFSCSHHAALNDFTAAVAKGLSKAGRLGRLIRTSAAGPDHPVHPLLAETAYLKGLVFQLD